MSGHSTWPLLASVAQAAVDGTALDPASVHRGATAWECVPDDAEAGGLAPLVHSYLEPHRAAVPEPVRRQLEALALRHRAWHRARTAAVVEILHALDRAAVQHLLLKGAALAWMIYPAPALRPMRDIDLLVAPAEADAAQATLVALGYRLEPPARPYGAPHHHLPIATRRTDGLAISVEVHLDALSRDTFSSIALGSLSDVPRTFVLDGVPARALGHVDTLRHLTHHLLEPSWEGRVRLLGVVDLLRYAAVFHDEIDWRRLRAQHPFVINALGCLHDVIRLPASLARFAPPPSVPRPDRIGAVIRPFRSALLPGRPSAAAVGELLNPPAWWLHAYYGVPQGRSLAGVRIGRHPWRVARWLGLRLVGF